MKVLNRNLTIAVTRPNWSGGVSEDYDFKTSVFRSRNGTEKREAMRQTARVSLQFLTTLRPAGMRRHMQDLAEDPTRLFYVPVRWRRTELAAIGAAAGDTVEVASAPYWAVAGQHVIITDEVNEEALTIASVAGNFITFTDVLSETFAAGSKLLMAHRARTASQSAFKALTDGAYTANVRYDVDPGMTSQAYAASSPVVFEGREVLITKPNWREGIENSFDALFEKVDSGRGTITVSTPELDNTRVVKMGYSAMTAAAADELIAFFLRHKGKRTGFFAPSWQRDVEAKVTAAAATSSLTVDGEDFADSYGLSQVYNVVVAFFANGSYQVNRIASVAPVGPDSVLTMTDAWDQDVTPSTKVSFCHHSRFASDTLSVNWITSEVAETELTVQTIQAGEND